MNFRMKRDKLTHIFCFLLLCIVLLVLCTGFEIGPSDCSDDAQELHEKGGETSKSVADLFTSPSCCTYCIIFGLVSGAAAGLTLFIGVFIVWVSQKSTTISCISVAKKKNPVGKKAQLQKQSQKTQEELAAWAVVLTPLMDLKRGLWGQREEFRLQLEEIDREREESKEKLQLVEEAIAESEKEKATDKTEGYLREKQSLLKAQWKLEKRKEELENQQLNMEKLLQKTEGTIATITERESGEPHGAD
ncbi:uncharacterized protein LOC125884005 isoform X2 [Epinephelus fuscoguttatus]|uniref:uncharacterized protein LOC125884005 isoform X2 n=1 Tax=Epinephelus fuscoguttatus TaxID=293821 RepID=UPI0020D13B0A|nr:uncharacterized protein LOC125884005 isoform X2 [Epinephelus fuscoguttatus]